MAVISPGQARVRIEQIILREIQMPLVEPFETSMGRTTLRRIVLVEVRTEGVSGWGEVTAGETPSYSPETTETAWHVLRDFLAPAVQGRELAAAAEFDGLVRRVRGHNMAKAGLEMALWDAEAKQKAQPLWKFLGGTRGKIPCGVSIGIQPTLDQLLGKIERELAAGYQRIKIKIRPGWDAAACEAVREKFPEIRLMADANSAYTLDDTPLLKQLERYRLMMLEQPLGWDDLYAHVKLQMQLRIPVCLDECIHSEAQAAAAVELGACRIINVKLGRVGGHRAARRIHDLCRDHGVPVWCGGMLESGIGRAQNIALSTLENFSLPGDVSASRRYWEADVIEPEVEVSPEGTIAAPSGPGIGFEVRLDRIERLTARKEMIG
jgi:o-succinylbenzoate synthase